MAVVVECPHCFVLLKDLPSDPHGELECPRCHHRIPRAETAGPTVAEATPPPKTLKRRDSGRLPRDSGAFRQPRREVVPEPAPEPKREVEEAPPAIPANQFGLV